MVEQRNQLDLIFSSLSDPTRRDILRRVAKHDMNIKEIAENYRLTFAAVAKHLVVLQKAQLISKRRNGKEQIITITPEVLAVAEDYLENYRNLWENRLDSLGNYLYSINHKGEK